MGWWKDLREVMKNPPEERLCLINAGGYKWGILTILVISFIIFQTVIWYVSFIFLVQLISNWVGYKREMNRYNNIIAARKEMGTYQEIKDDPSFSRRRFRLITEELGDAAKYITAVLIIASLSLFSSITFQPWQMRLLIAFLMVIGTLIAMLFPVYWIAQLKRAVKNGKNRK